MPLSTQTLPDSTASYVRITIDSGGIKEIKRVHAIGEPSTPATSHELFIFENVVNLASVKAHFLVSCDEWAKER
jgi:hypothetical protein